VGSTTLLSRSPVEPTAGVGVISGPLTRDDKRPLKGPCEGVGCRTDCGTPPVEPGTRKGPRKLDAPGDEGSIDGTGDDLAGTMVSGSNPLDATP
jgi:hypothetical protein